MKQDMSNSINNTIANESNPLASNLKVRLSVPASIDIEIVEATHLKEYEIWAVVSSLMLNLLVGFVVAATTNTVKERTVLLWAISAIFFLLLIGAVIIMIVYRKKISRDKQTVRMVASSE